MRAALVLLLAAVGCAGPTGPRLDPADIAANNRGVGLMGQFDFDAARQVFAELVARRPDWTEAEINLAIAITNRQSEGDSEAALAILQTVLERAPDNLRAHYCTAILLLHKGEAAEAAEHFRLVAEADPDDAYAAYFLGQALAQANQAEQALAWFARARALDPYLRSAHYGTFRALMSLGKRDEAREALEMFQRLADNPQARLAEIKYTPHGTEGDGDGGCPGRPRAAGQTQRACLCRSAARRERPGSLERRRSTLRGPV